MLCRSVCTGAGGCAELGRLYIRTRRCNRSQLGQSQLADVDRAAHRRNVVNCRNGYESCKHSALSEREAPALAVANHRRNVSDCNDGIGHCDRSKLSSREALEVAATAVDEWNSWSIVLTLVGSETDWPNWREWWRFC